MKERKFLHLIAPQGILRWSTGCILAGGVAGLTSCEKRYVATPQDEKMAKIQAEIDVLDAQKAKLVNGEAANNLHLEGVGYYHAEARDFFEYPYGFQQEGRWFVNGKWQDTPAPAPAVASSRPSAEALKKVEAALELEQQQLAAAGKSGTTNTGTTYQHHHSGFGTGLMMYWLLAGNRGSYSPGMGFQQAGSQVGTWQQGVDDQRRSVSSYAAANPGYQRMVTQSKTSGTPVRAGQSVRGGFGSSSRSSAS